MSANAGPLFAQAVADAGFGGDQARGGGVGLQLLAELAHEDAQVLHVLGVGRAPDGRQELLVGDDLAAARHELAGGAATLADLGVDAGGRLARAAAELGTQLDNVRRTAAILDESTATARADLGVLLTDLVRPGDAFSPELRDGLVATFGETAAARTETAAEVSAYAPSPAGPGAGCPSVARRSAPPSR